MKKQIITRISIVTAQGAQTYSVGDKLQNDFRLDEIRIEQLHFQGDPYDHYCGFAEGGEMLFSVNCIAPVEILYTYV